jgi:hypothetical protein
MDRSTRLGFMSGFLATLLITILYINNPTLLVDGYERITLIILFVAVVYGVSQERTTALSPNRIEDLLETTGNEEEELADFVSFGELLKFGFKVYVIGFFIKFSFIYFLFNYYDPTLIEMVKEAYVNVFIEYRDPTDTELIFEQKLADFETGNFAPRFTNILGVGFELVLGFFIAFFTALLFKREQPEY